VESGSLPARGSADSRCGATEGVQRLDVSRRCCDEPGHTNGVGSGPPGGCGNHGRACRLHGTQRRAGHDVPVSPACGRLRCSTWNTDGRCSVSPEPHALLAQRQNLRLHAGEYMGDLPECQGSRRHRVAAVKRPASGRAAPERRTLARLSISRAGAHHRRAQRHRWRRPSELDVRGFALCRSHGKAIRRIYDSIHARMSANDSIERQSTGRSTRRPDSAGPIGYLTRRSAWPSPRAMFHVEQRRGSAGARSRVRRAPPEQVDVT